ncbi:MAG: UV damage repair endonuclease UvsE [Lentisphaerae bacterium RIFOXYC12_FULL_60_16]|nr:MAG: UV damage repair endonuclease UvsE [Lentisphaerae bacterium RIFOXYC12_FULL_60_16]OGV71862.1 MAG: UV damage repair endonuclease UvsE [Lentisphaerae bacterium RIFOXYA12_FULL_60_10]OGV86657.1 MAG: UV damage repair endonuclease UvsE [Lentisphaerae bacterium RIFOXYB12_FULL_60_10]
MPRFGLCCKFAEEPIRFRMLTAAHAGRMGRRAARTRLADIARDNAGALEGAIRYCHDHGIGAFRVNSQVLPLATHPACGYRIRDLPGGRGIEDQFRNCGRVARRLKMRLSFHPDQFILLNSPSADIHQRSLAELEYQAEVAGWIGADVINLHGGGAYGDKVTALQRLVRNIRTLPSSIRSRLTLENDDRVYTPSDLLPVCRETGTPLVYDVHHHRCLPDELSVEEATRQAMQTWKREPIFHVSSPIHGWKRPPFRPHHDYISIKDFPSCWRTLDITIEVEAKAKEKAVLKLLADLKTAS